MSILIEKESQFTFPQQIIVKGVQMAFNSTFVVLYYTQNIFDKFSIMHIGDTFKKEYSFDEQNSYFTMVNPEQVVFPLKQSKVLVLLNLKTQKEKRIEFDFLQYPHSFELFYFKSTNLVCIKEIRKQQKYSGSDSDQNDKESITIWKNLNITYIGAKLEEKQFFSYKISKEDKQNFFSGCDCLVSKGNNHSLLIFQKKRSFQIILFDIQQTNNNIKWDPRIRSLKLKQLYQYSLFDISLQIFYWEFKQNQLFFIRTSAVHNKIGSANIQNGKINQIKIEKNQLKYLNLCKAIFLDGYIFLTKKDYISDTDNNIKDILIGFGEQGCYNVETLPHNNSTNTITNACSYDFSTIVKYALSQDKKQLKIRLIKPIIPQQIYLDMLLHINQDFDDDLLLDAVRLLANID